MDTKTRNAIKKTLSETPASRLPLPLAYSDPAFARYMEAASRTPELIQAFDRLTVFRIGAIGTRSAIERMVDEATGFQDEQMRQLVEFVHDSIYLRIPDEAVNAFRVATEIENESLN